MKDSRVNLSMLPTLVGALALLAAGCAGPQNYADIPAEELYRQAKEAVREHDFEDADELIGALKDEHPFSKFAVEAELLQADAEFEAEKWEEAAAAYRAFEELHPTHREVSYAVYRRGLAYEAQALGADRDQTATRDAVEAYQKLVLAYPDSQWAPEARTRLAALRGRLADHELYVARYYLRKKAVGAARGRLDALVATYPDTPAAAEARGVLAQLPPSNPAPDQAQ